MTPAEHHQMAARNDARCDVRDGVAIKPDEACRRAQRKRAWIGNPQRAPWQHDGVLEAVYWDAYATELERTNEDDAR